MKNEQFINNSKNIFIYPFWQFGIQHDDIIESVFLHLQGSLCRKISREQQTSNFLKVGFTTIRYIDRERKKSMDFVQGEVIVRPIDPYGGCLFPISVVCSNSGIFPGVASL